MTLRTLNYGNYGIFLIMGNAGLISLNPKPQNPIDPLKEPLKGTLIDPFTCRFYIINTIADSKRTTATVGCGVGPALHGAVTLGLFRGLGFRV